MGISGLGYVTIAAKDIGAWESFAQDILGMSATRNDDGSLNLRMDDQEWRIRVALGAEDDLDVIGWEVADHASFDNLLLSLAESGWPAEVADAQAAAQRGVKRLALLRDPDGNPHELFVAARKLPQKPFVSPQGCQFKTSGIGLGHLAMTCQDLPAMVGFYTKLLGFRVSDYIDTEVIADNPLALTFLRCNGRHHSLALAQANLPKRLLHLMVEVTSIDEVGFALTRCEDAGIRLGFSLGRHTNDQMLSFYPCSPSGFDIEFGFGGLLVDDDNWGQCHKFRVWCGIMGKKETYNVTTQRACDPG
jgi:2,3-dihydroxybiphenyl 1,2-dioxygenase